MSNEHIHPVPLKSKWVWGRLRRWATEVGGGIVATLHTQMLCQKKKKVCEQWLYVVVHAGDACKSIKMLPNKGHKRKTHIFPQISGKENSQVCAAMLNNPFPKAI